MAAGITITCPCLCAGKWGLNNRMSLWDYADKFAAAPPPHRITLGEGRTPLIRSRRIGPAAGLDQLYFKVETSNPSGSYKDRFAAAAVADMLARGKRRCVATSSGNTGSALAAYCAAAGIACQIAIVETAPQGKLKQMLAYGAKLVRIRGFGLDAQVTAGVMEWLEQTAAADDAALQISAFKFSPVGMSGVQTISYELAEQLPAAEHVFVPAGGGGLTLAVARGYQKGVRHLFRGPAVHCVQPEGNDTIATPLRQGEDRARPVQCTSTISGLQVATVIDGDGVIPACRASGGTGHTVTDEEVYGAQQRLAREEGLFCEPAGAVALAGALKAAQNRDIALHAPVVCLVTGSAFKDPPSLDRMTEQSSCPLVDVEQMQRLWG